MKVVAAQAPSYDQRLQDAHEQSLELVRRAHKRSELATRRARPIREASASNAERRHGRQKVQDHAQIILPATSRRGKARECRVTITALRERDRSVGGITLLMEEVAPS
jgi:hypothetical protein